MARYKFEGGMGEAWMWWKIHQVCSRDVRLWLKRVDKWDTYLWKPPLL